ncbi:hypothetical protein PP175_18435 [Aneurinibacillus sp. Ricciae_BoGa-3]|uniref:hypothetical protein n=1 Tax=Aneurinibacillus sp. Ricciae_BoGa-3 TaxID=3022697 RepID=UPI00233FFDD6|nr:hypothetical protein [Aneurinibacillus sp. Ricciae_BoGa-3]WCK53336.1 hypothetical protein PP175_18435 [Aneurinibacillus sp. Ricciae_BoGa-3]
MIADRCIYCGEELVLWEKSRCYCSSCKDLTEITYADDVYYAEDEMRHDDYLDQFFARENDALNK